MEMKKDLAPAISLGMAIACAAAITLLCWQLAKGASLRKMPAPAALQGKRTLPPLPAEPRLRSLRRRVASLQRLNLPSGLELSPLLAALERLSPQGCLVEEI